MKTDIKRSTIYLDASLHKALKFKAAHLSKTISELVNDAVKVSLTEDYEDLAAFEQRMEEPNIDFEKAIKNLHAGGKI